MCYLQSLQPLLNSCREQTATYSLLSLDVQHCSCVVTLRWTLRSSHVLLQQVLPPKQRRESDWVAFLISSTFSGMFPGTFRNLRSYSEAGGMAAPQRSRRWTNSEEIHVLMIHKLVRITQCKPSCSATRQPERLGLLESNDPVPPLAISMWGQLTIWIDGTSQSIKTPGYMTGFQMQSGLPLIKHIHRFNFKQFSCCFFYCCLLPEFLAKKKSYKMNMNISLFKLCSNLLNIVSKNDKMK